MRLTLLFAFSWGILLPQIGWSSQILFASDPDGIRQIYFMDVDTGETRKLTNSPTPVYEPAISPDGKTLLYVMVRPSRPSDAIYATDIDGGNERLFVAEGSLWRPSWSPRGDYVACRGVTQVQQLVSDLYAVDVRTGKVTSLIDKDANVVGVPAWSPDGKRIAVSGGPFGGYIWTINPDGSDKQVPYTGRNVLACCSWSTDGATIAFARREPIVGRPDDHIWPLYAMNPDGSNVRLLPGFPPDSYLPRWSPDGKQIVFQVIQGTANRPEGGYITDIYIMDADGSNMRNLTHSPADEEDPVWMPSIATAVSPIGRLTTTWVSLKQKIR